MIESYEQYARKELRPHFNTIQECYDEAFENLRRHLAITPALTERSKANIVRDSVVNSIREKFNPLEGFKIVEVNDNSEGLVLLLVGNRIAIRFKKLTVGSDGFAVSNNHTEQSHDLVNQQLELDNGEETLKPIFVSAGYILNKTGTSYTSLHLVCHHGEQVVWDIAIDSDNNIREEVADEFNFKASDEPGIKRDRIKPKKSDIDKAANDETR